MNVKDDPEPPATTQVSICGRHRIPLRMGCISVWVFICLFV